MASEKIVRHNSILWKKEEPNASQTQSASFDE